MAKRTNKNDECYTKSYAIYPLLKYLERFRGQKIWCPFDTEKSKFVQILRKNGYEVISSHISEGKDFYSYEPEEWDLIVSNPPFSNKSKTFERCMDFKKPFALLMSLDWLNDKAPFRIFGEDLQLLLFDERMTFDNQSQHKQIPFKTVYFCRDFLPRAIVCSKLAEKYEQINLFSEKNINGVIEQC